MQNDQKNGSADQKTETMPKAGRTEAIPGSHETAGATPETESGMDTNQDAEIGGEGFSEPSPAPKRRNFVPIIAGAAAVVLIAAGGIAFALNQPPAESPNTEPAAVENVTPAADEQKKETAPIYVTVDMTQPKVVALDREGMTPFIAHVKGTTDGAKDVDFYTALTDDGNGRFEGKFDGVKGEKYSVDIIDSIMADGSIAHSQDDLTDLEDKPLNTVDTKNNAFDPSQEYIPVEEVTQEQIDEIMDQLADAVAKGDETLTGEKGQAVIDAAASNAAANPNIDLGKVAEKADLAKENVSDTPTDTTGGSNGSNGSSGVSANSSSNGSGSSTDQGSSGSGGSSKPAVDNSTPAPAPTPAPTPTPTPKPEPVWVDEVGHWENVQVGQNWVPNIVEVSPAKPAWQFSDGHVEYTQDGVTQYGLNTGLGFSTITIPAVTEDRGYWEPVYERKWIVDTPGYWK